MLYPKNRKTRAYFGVWMGLFASAVMVLANIFPLGRLVEGLVALIVGVNLPIYAFYNRFDEHFRALARNGFGWGMTVLGVWLAALGLLTIYEGAFAAGMTAGGAPTAPDDFTFRLPDWFNRAFLIAALSSLAFHLGFLKAYWRGR